MESRKGNKGDFGANNSVRDSPPPSQLSLSLCLLGSRACAPRRRYIRKRFYCRSLRAADRYCVCRDGSFRFKVQIDFGRAASSLCMYSEMCVCSLRVLMCVCISRGEEEGRTDSTGIRGGAWRLTDFQRRERSRFSPRGCGRRVLGIHSVQWISTCVYVCVCVCVCARCAWYCARAFLVILLALSLPMCARARI